MRYADDSCRPMATTLVYYWCTDDRNGLPVITVSILSTCKSAYFCSGAEGIRTPDLRRAKAALSRLSYGPDIASWGEFTAVAWGGLMVPEFGGRA
jgi:hypothetical protein